MRLALLLAVAVILIRDPTGKWANDPCAEVTAATKSGIDYEDRADCRSPRGEGSLSACCRRGDGNHAD